MEDTLKAKSVGVVEGAQQAEALRELLAEHVKRQCFADRQGHQLEPLN